MADKLYLLNTMYLKPKFQTNQVTGKSVKVRDDALIMNIKNLNTNETTIKVIEKPKIDFYLTKDKDYKYPKLTIDEDKVEKITCPYTERELTQAKLLGIENLFFESCRQGYYAKKMFIQNFLYNSPRLYMADINIEDYYINLMFETYGRRNFYDHPVVKLGFSDIEVDQYDYKGEGVSGKNAVCPVNLITLVNSFRNDVYAFILENQQDNPDFYEIKNNEQAFIEEIEKEIDNPKYKNKYKYHLLYFETEVELIEAFFKLTHELKLDFIGWWNMNFDIPYLLGRLAFHERDINEIVCHT